MPGSVDRGQSQVVGTLLLVGVAVGLLAPLAFSPLDEFVASGGVNYERSGTETQMDGWILSLRA